MVYFCYSSSLNVSNYCPFGFLLVMFPLRSCYFCACFFPFDVSDGRCWIIVSIPDHCLSFYCEGVHYSHRSFLLFFFIYLFYFVYSRILPLKT